MSNAKSERGEPAKKVAKRASVKRQLEKMANSEPHGFVSAYRRAFARGHLKDFDKLTSDEIEFIKRQFSMRGAKW